MIRQVLYLPFLFLGEFTMEEGEIMYSRPVAIKIIKKNPNGSYVIEYIENKKKEILTELELFRRFQPRLH